MAFVFQNQNWIKSHHVWLRSYLKKYGLATKWTALINYLDYYYVCSLNFFYLLQLLQINVKKYQIYFFLLRLLVVVELTQNITQDKMKVDPLLKVIQKIKHQLNIPNIYTHNYETNIYTQLSSDLVDSHHLFYRQIGQVFAMIAPQDKALYYRYGYYLAMLILHEYLRSWNRFPNALIMFQFKLMFFHDYVMSLADISPTYFNTIVIKNNKILAKVFRKYHLHLNKHQKIWRKYTHTIS